MKFSRLYFRPGIVRETTEYTNEGGWYEMDKVRFRYGLPEKINGWERSLPIPYLGGCRSLTRWTTLDGTELVAIATNQKLYIQRSSSLFDITPLRSTTTPSGAPCTANMWNAMQSPGRRSAVTIVCRSRSSS